LVGCSLTSGSVVNKGRRLIQWQYAAASAKDTTNDRITLLYLLVTYEIKLFQLSLTSVWKIFISAHGKLPEIISELFRRHYCSS